VTKPANVVQEMFKEETDRVMKTVFTELVENASANANKLPEEVFVKEFLPFFSGQVTRESRPNTLATWIGIAGSPAAEVAVVDQKGDVIYNVPGVFDTSFLTLNRGKERGGDYDQIIDQSNMLKTNLPQEGNRYLTEALAHKFKTIEQKAVVSPNEQRWVNIFHRYGIDVPGHDDPSNSKNKPNGSIVDDEVYE